MVLHCCLLYLATQHQSLRLKDEQFRQEGIVYVKLRCWALLNGSEIMNKSWNRMFINVVSFVPTSLFFRFLRLFLGVVDIRWVYRQSSKESRKMDFKILGRLFGPLVWNVYNEFFSALQPPTTRGKLVRLDTSKILRITYTTI